MGIKNCARGKLLKSTRSPLHAVCCTLLASTLLHSPAWADVIRPEGPRWVSVKVASCSAVTFEAPKPKHHNFVRGEKFRTALITGTVEDEGLLVLRRESVPDKQGQSVVTPSRGASVAFVLRDWSAEICDTLPGTVERLEYNYDCDTLPRRGACIPPFPLVTISKRYKITEGACGRLIFRQKLGADFQAALQRVSESMMSSQRTNCDAKRGPCRIETKQIRAEGIAERLEAIGVIDRNGVSSGSISTVISSSGDLYSIQSCPD